MEDSLAVTDWKKMDDAAKDDKDGTDSLLAPGDLIRIYLAYTIPAGSLNATNPVARYRLPSNLHLTDRQVEAINQTENGISKSYVDLNTLEITDLEKHEILLMTGKSTWQSIRNKTAQNASAQPSRLRMSSIWTNPAADPES